MNDKKQRDKIRSALGIPMPERPKTKPKLEVVK